MHRCVWSHVCAHVFAHRPHRLFVVTMLGARCLILEGDRDRHRQREDTETADPPTGTLPNRKSHKQIVPGYRGPLDEKDERQRRGDI